MRRFTVYPSNYVSASDKASFCSSEEWEQSGKDFENMTPEEKAKMTKRAKARRVEQKKNPPMRQSHMGKGSFSNPDGSEKYKSLQD